MAALAFLMALGAGLVAYFLFWPLDCGPGFADCNGRRSDGCEVELAKNALHCGGCGNACPTAQGAAACVNGACRIERCTDESTRDCNGVAQDGCEVDVSADPRNCGGCGRACSESGTTKVGCRDSKCELACRKDHGDCDQNPQNGCEVLLSTDAANCGRCGLACRDTRCEHGFCVPKRIASLEPPLELAAAAGYVYVWESKTGRVRRLSASGEERVLAEAQTDVTALAVTPKRLLWVGGEPARVFALSHDADAGAAAPIAGPLSGPTELVLDLNARHVSWADRPARGKGKRPAPGAKHTISTLDLGAEDSKPQSVKCPDWPARFAGDDRQQYCCDRAKPLASITCPDGKCTSRTHPFPCPELMLLDDEHLYFFRGTRLFAFDRSSAKAVQLAKRVRAPRELAQDATHVYWLEGDADAAVFRLRKPERGKAAADAPDAIAGKLRGARALAIDDGSIYFTQASGSGVDLLTLKKPQ